MTTLFHSLTYAAADRAITWLTEVGFTEQIVVRDDSGAVVHAEFGWREDGGVMFGSPRDQRADPDTSDCFNDAVGTAKCYCVVADDAEVDAVFARAVAAGAREVQPPVDQDYGGRSCTVTDPEGNQWSFGSYAGASSESSG